MHYELILQQIMMLGCYKKYSKLAMV